MKPLRIGSLCSGYEGLGMSVQAVLGGELAWVADPDPDASRVLAHHWPDVPNLSDITKVHWEDVVRVDVLCAGYPCQPFSFAGGRKGEQDERHIWPHIAQAVRVLRPRLVVLENVAGHRSLGFGRVLGDLAEAGYDAEWVCVRASDAGAPHSRERVFLVAYRAATDAERGGWGGWAGHLAKAQGRHEPAYRGDTTPGIVLFPTPTGANSHGNHRNNRGDLLLPGVVANLLPTPTAADSDRTSSTYIRGNPTLLGAVQGAVDLLPTPCVADATGTRATRGGSRSNELLLTGIARDVTSDRGVEWGKYELAVRRWEKLASRAAPCPTEPAPKGGRRLSPLFTEWMMGVPPGHITAVPCISRNAMIRLAGNGVVPQQAAVALRLLLPAVLDAQREPAA